jgi:hypothetical protein
MCENTFTLVTIDFYDNTTPRSKPDTMAGTTKTLSQKVQDLFMYRRIPELLRIAGIEQDSLFVPRLYTLQEAIYALDLHLESGWKLDKTERKRCWEAIYEALKGFGISKGRAKKYVRDIKRYETYELAMHELKLPRKIPFREMYTFKSCDVKLVRKLIYRHAPGLEKQVREQDWGLYDLVSEVNDDIHDVYEDCETVNGNRFIISLLLSGRKNTRRSFKKFLRQIREETGKHFKRRKKPHQAMLYTWTKERLLETEELLRSTMDNQRLSLVEHSVLAQKLYKGKKKGLKS